jgi:serine/threonine kinase 16
MAQYFFDLLYTFTDCMCCFPHSPQLKINNRSLKLLRLLGEVQLVLSEKKRRKT